MSTLISVIHIITCILIVGVVLINSGKGAEISATFGGSSQTVFGSSGGANFFSRLTFGLAFVFMVTSLGLTILSNQSRKSVFETTGLEGSTPITAPVANPASGSAATPASSATSPEAAKPAQAPAQK